MFRFQSVIPRLPEKLFSLNLSCMGSPPVRYNSNRASISRINRRRYAETYPTMLVFPNGSTITIRYKEPRAIIKLPLDLSTLSENERIARLAKRKPKTKVVVEEEIEDSFDLNQYSHLWKKK